MKKSTNLETHNWVGRKLGGNPSDACSYEWVRYCSVCGMEDTCEDPLPPCPGESSKKLGEESKDSIYTVDCPEIRLDEHDRSCIWCAQHEERCLRGQLLEEEAAKAARYSRIKADV